jgi:hypothetical protein
MKRKHGIRRSTAGVAVRIAAAAVTTLVLSANTYAQVPVDEDGNTVGSASPLDGVDVENPFIDESGALEQADLESLVGPIALYPDDLLAVVLPASTYPLEIVQAARFLDQVEVDPSLEPDDEWDDSVVALLNYPDVLRMMNEDIDWTWQLGEAVVRQQADVILAIETFRDRAYAAGNLKSDEYQTVSVGDEGIIEIDPVREDALYVPYYEPERVVYYSPTPVYFYYPRAYPVYYYPYPRHHYLTNDFFWGVTTAFTIGWATDHLHVYHHSYRGHPYYGWNYNFFGSYWRRPSINIYNTWYVNRSSPTYRYRHYRGDHWRPRHRSGARPRTRVVSDGYYREREYRDQSSRRARRSTTAYEGRERVAPAGNRTNSYRARTDGGAATVDRSRNLAGSVAGNDRRSARQPADRRSVNRSSERDRIRFRPRGDGSYSASTRTRVQSTSRPGDARRNSEMPNRQAGERTLTTTRRAAAPERRTEQRSVSTRPLRRETQPVTRAPRVEQPAPRRAESNSYRRTQQPRARAPRETKPPARSDAGQSRRVREPAASVRRESSRQRPATAPRQSRSAAKTAPQRKSERRADRSGRRQQRSRN